MMFMSMGSGTGVAEVLMMLSRCPHTVDPITSLKAQSLPGCSRFRVLSMCGRPRRPGESAMMTLEPRSMAKCEKSSEEGEEMMEEV